MNYFTYSVSVFIFQKCSYFFSFAGAVNTWKPHPIQIQLYQELNKWSLGTTYFMEKNKVSTCIYDTLSILVGKMCTSIFFMQNFYLIPVSYNTSVAPSLSLLKVFKKYWCEIYNLI